jgi:transposase
VEGFRTMSERRTRAVLSGVKLSFRSGSSGCRPSRVHEQTCRYQAVAQVSERKTILTRGAQAMKSHQDAVIRLAEVPGLGVDSAERIIAEAGAQASTFPSVARRKAINACAEC